MPTFDRPERLERLLLHLSLQIDSELFRELDLEIVIGDGFSEPKFDVRNNKQISYYLSLLRIHAKIQLLSLPGKSFASRLRSIAQASQRKFILLLGDDDLVILKNVKNLLLKHVITEGETISGRVVNIVGLSLNGIRYNQIERPYYGITIDHTSPVVRLSQYFTLNSVGTNPLAYSIQARDVFLEYTRLINNKFYYYGGFELIHQVTTLISGKVILSTAPLIFRDFMYLDYKMECQREAPSSDKYPYFGNEAVITSGELIAKKSEFTKEEAIKFVDYLIHTSENLQRSRNELKGALVFPLAMKIDESDLSIACKAWQKTYKNIYKGKSYWQFNLRRIPFFDIFKNIIFGRGLKHLRKL